MWQRKKRPMLAITKEPSAYGAGAMPSKRNRGVPASPPDRETFVLGTVAHLVDTLETVVGEADAAGFVAVVGQRIGESYEPIYRAAAGRKRLTREQVVDAILDLERRIHGEFYLVAQDDERIVLGNRACPFGERVRGHPSMCMMTSSVLGVMVAQNLGYARVALGRTIADGHTGCEIVIHLKPPAAGAVVDGREYFEV
jgi:predicted ArsR family transcriptional regulator